MSAYDAAALRAELERDEGNRPQAYDDDSGHTILPGSVVKGWVTIAIGRNLIGRGLSPDEVEILYENDRSNCERALDGIVPWWRSLTDARQRALLNLCWFGSGTLSSFTTFLELLEHANYAGAADDLLRTKLAQEDPARIGRLAALIRSG